MQTLGFRSSDSGSNGNFLDDVQIELTPYVELQPGESSGAESIGSANLPTLRLAGTLTKPLTLTVSVSGTATLGKDFTTPNGTDKFTVDIPAGDYDGTNGVASGIKVTNDSDIESNETIILTIEANSAAYTLASTTTCGGKSTTTTKYTILDDDARITVKKQLTGKRVNPTDQFKLFVADASKVALAATTTTGTGTTVTGFATANVVGGSKYTVMESASGAAETPYLVESYECVNANAASGTALPSGKTLTSFDITPAVGDDITCTFKNAPYTYALTLVKSVTFGNFFTKLNERITYSYTVTNSGNIPITDPIGIYDDKIPAMTCPSLPAGGLLPNASLVCSATYSVKQADLDANKITNIAHAAIGKIESARVSATAYRAPALGLDIKITPNPYAAVGAKIVYTYTVTNIGNLAITKPILITDDKYTVKCNPLPAGGLAAKATLTCTAEYTVKQEDLDAGKIVNIASATSQGVPPSVPVTGTALAEQKQGLTLEKKVAGGLKTYAAVGEKITYDYTVSNTGNVTITKPISVTDDKIGNVTCPNLPSPPTPKGSVVDGKLAPGVKIVCTAEYLVTQDDLDGGSVTNKAQATDGVIKSNEVLVTAAATQAPALKLEKTITTGDPFKAVGDKVGYSYKVTNTGNVTITKPISISDNKIGKFACSAPTDAALKPGDILTCAADYSVTQIDLDTGSVTNKAQATDGATKSPEVFATATATQASALKLEKTITTGDPFKAVGDKVSYSYKVTNTGNLTITKPISISDNKIGNVTCPSLPSPLTVKGSVADGRLAPGGILTCTADYSVLQADLDTGSVTNKAQATDGVVKSNEVVVTTAATQAPALKLEKSITTGDPFKAVGDKVSYSYKVTNTGNVTITKPTFDDKTFTALYTLKQADIDAGKVDNAATVTATLPSGGDISSDGGVTTPITAAPGLVLEKKVASPSGTTAGSTIAYSFTVKNTGNVTLKNIRLTDKLVDALVSGDPIAELAPGAFDDKTFTALYTLKQADIDAGKVDNAATVTGTLPSGSDISSDGAVTTPIVAAPGLVLEKKTGPPSGNTVGSTITYSFTVKNTGNVTLKNIRLGALAAVTYEPTAEDSYYLGYRLDPDRAFDLDRTYDLDGTDYGAIVIGARRKLDDYWSTYAENNYDLFGRRNSLAQTYGVVYTPDAKWTVDGGLEIGTVEDDTIDPSTNLERSDFDRKAISLSVGYKDEDRIAARIRGETRFEDSDDDTRDLNTYLFATGFSWKTNDNWRLLANIDSVLSDSNGDGSFRDGDYVEASLGYAYRPVTNDRLNALFKYTWLYDLPGEDQVSAVTGDEYGPAQRSNILSADFTYDLVPWLSVGAKYGFRYGEVRERLQDDLDEFSDWQTSSAHLGIVRTDFHIVKKWDALLEGRVMYMAEADTTDLGVLTAVYRHVGENFKVGVGYNFGNFSDDLRDLTLNDRGVFFNVVGKY
ncbi:hypothetical protein [Phyllobacterium sp. SYP-B3895]|uniref:DUF7507 domain-containing protein n=1 Tax=Phyllobacterium sp. SYP-B3895 TaxID=2663240 RepID=UPI001562390C|nr:hypothetical protein [Phyllobacterium sp. SYP-B3895]